MPGKRPPLPRGPAKKPGKSRPRKKGGYVEAVAAAVYIKRAADMTSRGRRQIAAWLIDHAEMLVAEGKNYSASFRGRYYYGA